MEQEKILYMANIEREIRILEENMQIINNQILELEDFTKNLKFIRESKENEILTQIGSRIYIKSKIEDKNKLLVETGAGVVVEKSPEETINVIEEQVSKLKQARIQISSQLESYYAELREFIGNIK